MKNEADRERVILEYQLWLHEKLADRDSLQYAELSRLKMIAKKGDLYLYCFCHPARCHGDILAELLK